MTDATELDEAAVREAVEGADARQWAEEWWRCHADGYFRAAMGAVPELVAYFATVTPTNLRLLLDEIARLRAEVNRENAQMLAVQDELHEALTEICEHKAAMTDMRRRKEAAESALASTRTLARSWSGRHDLLMTGDSAAHDIETALATPTTTERSEQ